MKMHSGCSCMVDNIIQQLNKNPHVLKFGEKSVCSLFIIPFCSMSQLSIVFSPPLHNSSPISLCHLAKCFETDVRVLDIFV